MHKYFSVSYFSPAILTVIQLSPPCLHGDLGVLSVQNMPIYQSRVLTCVLPGGVPMSMCRHVSVPPISDCALILYMNYSFVELD